MMRHWRAWRVLCFLDVDCRAGSEMDCSIIRKGIGLMHGVVRAYFVSLGKRDLFSRPSPAVVEGILTLVVKCAWACPIPASPHLCHVSYLTPLASSFISLSSSDAYLQLGSFSSLCVTHR
ncbi:hypothetical protein E2C01_061936 [Portunus trituberculatus]|uniref:Secreted protein n=1 Tax=Portunus trituberculatus TaxID=210409 RepID=A0A5B7HCB3_PORTR|nr:hypothetical protein [Portunus trituberculatus]